MPKTPEETVAQPTEPMPPAAPPQSDLGAVVAALMAQVATLTSQLAAVQKTPEQEEARAKEAFKQVPFYRAVPPPVPEGPAPDGWVKVRVLEDGDGRVATGDYDPDQKAFTYYKWNDVFLLPEAIARAMGTDPDGKKVQKLVEIVR